MAQGDLQPGLEAPVRWGAEIFAGFAGSYGGECAGDGAGVCGDLRECIMVVVVVVIVKVAEGGFFVGGWSSWWMICFESAWLNVWMVFFIHCYCV
jgi:hypothetical protein